MVPPPKRAGLRSRAARPVGRSLAERQQPANMVCQRCGAEFAWERADKPGSPGTEWSARLVKGSEKCDCGYGLRSRNKRGPHP
nr:hypothetical protein [Roseospira goensis]